MNMKNLLTTAIVLFASLLIFTAFRGSENTSTYDAPPMLKYSKKVDAIIKDKCYGCHSPEGRSDKAKEKLMWDDLAGLSAADQAMKLKAISKVLSEGAMPPAKMLERMPEKALTEKETKVMAKWASKSLKKAMK